MSEEIFIQTIVNNHDLISCFLMILALGLTVTGMCLTRDQTERKKYRIKVIIGLIIFLVLFLYQIFF